MVSSDLDPRFTFESFVVGPANRLACAAARRAADSPGASYNPLFIYSDSGLGKSHILSAIAHYAIRVHPEHGVRYVAVESFLEELSRAIAAGEQDRLRERYEELDILLLDDVQFLTGQTEAQEMLLRLLDHLSAHGSQIVLASDRAPSDIDGLDVRLVSRFSGGLIVDIGRPEYETRVAILRRKAEERGQTLLPGVAEVVARAEFKNVRELAGALNKIIAVQELEGRQVDKDEVRPLLGLGPEPAGAGPDSGVSADALMDEFGAFIQELSSTVASKVEHEEAPWRRLLRQTAETFEADGYSATRLRRMLESDKAPDDPQAVVDRYRADIQALRQIGRELDRVGNPWPEAAIGLLKDPERVEEAASLLASARERVRPFPIIGEGPDLDQIAEHFPTLAVNAARKMLAPKRPEFNPLYLWSPDPLQAQGLLGAMGRSFIAEDPMRRVAITSAAEFAEDFIRALSQGVAGAWRERWWTVDLLLVYGAEALSETERAQDEFFHLFEAANRRGARVVIAADRPPSGIHSIDDRLRSRFEGGLVVEARSDTLPPALCELNLQEAPPEYIQDEDPWRSFERPKVADAVIPPLEELQQGERGGLFLEGVDPETGEAVAAPEGGTSPAAAAAQATPTGQRAWRPSRERVVWDWPSIEDRIVEDEE
ncbi:MAG: hypothetical protein D6701_10590 [Gemmatimonadetes bacterium]|nr:MAG: hypothetical protein D6701_10590 [Gemmatimonadota bacterium]